MRGPEASRVQVRRYAPADLDSLFALDQQCFPPEIAYSAGELRYFLETKDALALIAARGEQIDGFIIAQQCRGNPAFQARIITMDVAPARRRLGLASLLMHAAETELRAAHVVTVRLEVAVSNLAAQSFYRKFGYESIGRRKRYYPTGEDALVMQKRLD